MQPGRNISKERLRKIGWEVWDPIGLAGEEDWPPDEYDTYLLQAAGKLWNGASQQETADYLVGVEINELGLAPAPGARERALNVAGAIREYLDTLRTAR